MDTLIVGQLNIIVEFAVTIFSFFVIAENFLVLNLLLPLIILFDEVHYETSRLQLFVLFELSFDISPFELSRFVLSANIYIYFDRASVFCFQAKSVYNFIKVILIDV